MAFLAPVVLRAAPALLHGAATLATHLAEHQDEKDQKSKNTDILKIFTLLKHHVLKK